MKYLVTGGSGFLGSNLCRILLEKGNKVFALDSLITGSKENIKNLWKDYPDNFAFINGWSDEIPYSIKFDGIFHLASPAAPVDINAYPEITFRSNSRDTEKLLEWTKEQGMKFLFVSTMKIHGNCERVDSYIRGKREGEIACFGNGAKVARLASVFGPNMSVNDSRVIPVFITRALRNEPLSVWNGGSQVDSFCYVDDIVDALIRFMESDHSGVIELGSPEGISIMDLAKIILRITESKSEIYTYETITVINECHRIPDLKEAQNKLDWKPTVDLYSGLQKTVEYFRHEMSH